MTVGNRIKQRRARQQLTQQALADRLGVSQPLVAQWETGRTRPTDEMCGRLQEFFGEPICGTFGERVRAERESRGWSQAELAERAGLAMLTIHYIEMGRTQNPRDSTRRRIEEALGTTWKEADPGNGGDETRSQETVIGDLIEFNPHDSEDWPDQDVSGIYLFYDGTGRLVRVGKSENLGKRIAGHVEKFWFKEPIVTFGAYVPVRKDVLRKVEKLLLKAIGADHLVLNVNE